VVEQLDPEIAGSSVDRCGARRFWGFPASAAAVRCKRGCPSVPGIALLNLKRLPRRTS
jgi:hypothetical protein